MENLSCSSSLALIGTNIDVFHCEGWFCSDCLAVTNCLSYGWALSGVTGALFFATQDVVSKEPYFHSMFRVCEPMHVTFTSLKKHL